MVEIEVTRTTVVLESLGTPCAAATLLAISPDAYNLATCQLLLR